MKKMKERKAKNIFVEGPISPDFIAESIRKHATKHDIGAHEIFLGQVRADKAEDGTVAAIDYTAYQEMALDVMHEIRESTFEKWPITCMHVYHSLGEVEVGQICFFVFASSAHRKVAREAVARVVDAVKEKLPIFGKELIAGGDHRWKQNS